MERSAIERSALQNSLIIYKLKPVLELRGKVMERQAPFL